MNLPSEITLIDVKGKSFQFNTVENLTDFLKTEGEFWKEKYQEANVGGAITPYFEIYNTFLNAVIQMEPWRSNIPTWDITVWNRELNSIVANYFNQFHSYWLWSGHDFIDALINSYQLSSTTGDAFLEVMLNKQLSHRPNFDSLRGYILAYEFIQQDESLITKRRVAERATFATIRNQLAKKKDELIGEVADFQSEIISWKDSTKTEINAWQENQKQHFEDLSLNHSTYFQERIANWTSNVSDLEDKYREKLRFQGPATYWEKSASKFKEQGYYWTFSLVLLSAVFIVCLSYYFKAWLSGERIGLKLETLEGAILFASIISAFAILVRAFSKLAFSSFHLQRDAEEREQLTHLYLSLTNEKEVDVESRKIVLQALFSRSETGLLANESGPTMPGIGEVVNYVSRSGR